MKTNTSSTYLSSFHCHEALGNLSSSFTFIYEMKTTKAIKKENKNKQKNILAKKEDVETCWKLIANAIF